MPLLQVIVLAVVQGLTEFLPISSTAHLYLTSWLFGWRLEGLDFDIALHIGTLLAVLLYFARDWVQIIAQGFGVPRFQSGREVNNPRAARGASQVDPIWTTSGKSGPRLAGSSWVINEKASSQVM